MPDIISSFRDTYTSTRDSVKKFYEEFIPNIYDDMAVPKQIRDFWNVEDKVLDEIIEDGASVLDVGAGTGRHLAFLKRKGCRVIGLDYSKEMIEVAKKKVKHVEIILADMRDIPLSEDHVDYCTCMFSTLGNIEIGREKAIAEMMRVGRKKVIFSVYKESAKPLIKKWYASIGLHIKKDKENTIYLKEGLVSHFFSEKELEGLLIGKKYKITPRGLAYIVVVGKT